MRRIVAGLFMSIDGVVESPQTWQSAYFNDEMGAVVAARLAAADTLLLGRRTYEEFVAFWPNQSSDVPFADQMNNLPKVVASTTLSSVEWQNSTLLRSNVFQELARLKQQPGKDIAVTGSPTLVRSLLDESLLDELGLLVHPILVGSGKHLFENSSRSIPLKLIDTRVFRTGVLSLTYAGSQG